MPGGFVGRDAELDQLYAPLLGENNSGNVAGPVADRVRIVARLVKT